ncbi:MAG TPA: hypothetical protein VHW00_03215 [Thermoanaerobaculia bacterium]|nr:hypothetical protein [Thermoanaerobaculia bacterium]
MTADPDFARRGKRERLLGLGAFAIIVLVAVLAGFAHETFWRRHEQRATQVTQTVQWEERTLRAGDRVRIARWAGTFKPEDTRAAVEVDAAPGQRGVILRGESRENSWHFPIDPNEPIQVVRVRWDAQPWKQHGREQRIDLGEFEATIHVSYLEIVH